MTKRWLIPIVFIILAIVIWTYIRYPEKMPEEKASLPPEVIEEDIPETRKNGRKVVGLSPDASKAAIEQVEPINTVSPKWQEGLESTLKDLGGESLAKIDINKMDSFIWSQDGIALNVESVKVTLTDEAGETTSFKAMVDSETGKILQTWDQPVMDPANPREKWGIKLDPRYHQN